MKGYSRKGAALHALKQYDESIEAYEKGLEKFPGDESLSRSLGTIMKEAAKEVRDTTTSILYFTTCDKR